MCWVNQGELHTTALKLLIQKILDGIDQKSVVPWKAKLSFFQFLGIENLSQEAWNIQSKF